jgi:transposase-like protein
MSKKKDIVVCPKCYSKNISTQKGILPGGIVIAMYDTYSCDDCGNMFQVPFLVDESEYESLRKDLKNNKNNS